MNKNFITLFIVFIDQATKRLAHYSVSNGTYLISSFLKIKVCWNSGLSFGVGGSLYTWVLKLAVFTVCVHMFMMWRQVKNRFDTIVYSLILGGGISNLLDRFFYNSVLDFISIDAFGISFPVFNVADICISLGVLLMLSRHLPLYRK